MGAAILIFFLKYYYANECTQFSEIFHTIRKSRSSLELLDIVEEHKF